MSVSSYNSDKVKLQDSITKVYDTIRDDQNKQLKYEDIQDETSRVTYRQELIFNIVATVAVVSVVFTVRRLF
jgi:hypothetical protein